MSLRKHRRHYFGGGIYIYLRQTLDSILTPLFWHFFARGPPCVILTFSDLVAELSSLSLKNIVFREIYPKIYFVSLFANPGEIFQKTESRDFAFLSVLPCLSDLSDHFCKSILLQKMSFIIQFLLVLVVQFFDHIFKQIVRS